MKTASTILSLATLLPACGLIDKLRGKQKSKTKRPGHSPVEPIPYKKLIQLLPKLQGWQAKAPQGEKTLVGTDSITRASKTYEKKVDDKTQTLSLEIVDGSYVSSVYAPFAVMAHSRGATIDVHRMRIEVDGQPGIQNWKPEEGTVTVLLLVARRFVVSLKGSNIPPGMVKQSLHAIDLKKLASWAKADAPTPSAAR